MNVKVQPELIIAALPVVCPRKIRKKPKAIAIEGGLLANISMKTVAIPDTFFTSYLLIRVAKKRWSPSVNKPFGLS